MAAGVAAAGTPPHSRLPGQQSAGQPAAGSDDDDDDDDDPDEVRMLLGEAELLAAELYGD
jgi:hypothetical protein